MGWNNRLTRVLLLLASVCLVQVVLQGPGEGTIPPPDFPPSFNGSQTIFNIFKPNDTSKSIFQITAVDPEGRIPRYYLVGVTYYATIVGSSPQAATNALWANNTGAQTDCTASLNYPSPRQLFCINHTTGEVYVTATAIGPNSLMIDDSYFLLDIQADDTAGKSSTLQIRLNILRICGNNVVLLRDLQKNCQTNAFSSFSSEGASNEFTVGGSRILPIIQVFFSTLQLEVIEGDFTITLNSSVSTVSQVYTYVGNRSPNITLDKPLLTDTSPIVNVAIRNKFGGLFLSTNTITLYGVPATTSCFDNQCVASMDAWQSSVYAWKYWTSTCIAEDDNLLRFEYGNCANNKLPVFVPATFEFVIGSQSNLIGSAMATDPEGDSLTYTIDSAASPAYDLSTSRGVPQGIDDCVISKEYGTPRNFFCVEFATGKIMTTTSFAGKLGDVFTVGMSVIDSGAPQRRNTGTVLVKVIDDCHPASEAYYNITVVQSKLCSIGLRAATITSQETNNFLDFQTINLPKLIEIDVNSPKFTAAIPVDTQKLLIKVQTLTGSSRSVEFNISLKPFQLTHPFVLSLLESTTESVRVTVRPVNGSSIQPAVDLTSDAIALRGFSYTTPCNSQTCVELYQKWIQSRDSLPTSAPAKCREDPKRLFDFFDDCLKPPLLLSHPSAFFTTSLSSQRPLLIQCRYFSFAPISKSEWFDDGNVLPASDCQNGEEQRRRRQIAQRSNTCFLSVTRAMQQGQYKCRLETRYGASVTSETGLLQLTDVSTTRMKMKITSIAFVDQMNDRTSTQFINLNIRLQNWFSQVFPMINIGNYTHQLYIESVKKGSIIVDLSIYIAGVAAADRLNICQSMDNLRNATVSHDDGLGIQNLEIVNLDCCFSSTTGRKDLKGEYIWNTTLASTLVTQQPCSYSGGFVTRVCRPSFTTGPAWEIADDQQCRFESSVTNDLQILAETNITSANVTDVAIRLVNLTSNATAIVNEYDCEFTSQAMKNIADVESTLQEIANLLLEVANNLLQFSRVLVARAQKTFGSSSRVLTTLDFLAGQVQLPNESFTVSIELDSIALRVVEFNATSDLRLQGLTLSSPRSNATNSNMSVAWTSGNNTVLSLTSEATIYLPASLFDTAFNGATIGVTIRVTSLVFANGNLFIPESELDVASQYIGNSTTNRTIDTRVMSAALPGHTIRSLVEPMESYFNSLTVNGSANVASCVFWDFGTIGRGSWSTEGCRMRKRMNGQYVCECDHLTNFAVLLDVNDPGNAGPSPLVLEIITYIGCGISMAGLVLTLLTFAIFPNLRKTLPPRILMCLCVSILAVLIIFVVGIDRTSPRTGCQVVGLLLHYFVLATFCWMTVEGFNLYRSFVKVVGVYTHKFLLKASIFAWGLPAVIVGVTAGLEWDDYGNDKNCMLRGNTFYFAFLTPVLVVLVGNFIVLILVLMGIRRGSKLSKDRKTDAKSQMRIAFACSIILGLTWASAIFAVGDLKLTFQIVFCVLNSLQGFFIFMFYCVRNADVRKEWKRVLGMKAEDSRGSTTGSTGKKNQTHSTVDSKSGRSKKNSTPDNRTLLSNGKRNGNSAAQEMSTRGQNGRDSTSYENSSNPSPAEVYPNGNYNRVQSQRAPNSEGYDNQAF